MAELIPVAPTVLVWARQSGLATVAEAAEHTGQPDATILDWEAGRVQPTYSQLERLADEYGVFPGRTPSANLAVLDIVRVRHSLRHGCDCAGVDTRSAPRDQPLARAGDGRATPRHGLPVAAVRTRPARGGGEAEPSSA